MSRFSFTLHAIRILSLLMATTSAFGMSPPPEYFDQSDMHTQTPLPQPPPHFCVPANYPQHQPQNHHLTFPEQPQPIIYHPMPGPQHGQYPQHPSFNAPCPQQQPFPSQPQPQDPQAAWLNMLFSALPSDFPQKRKDDIQEIVRAASSALPQPEKSIIDDINNRVLPFLPPHKNVLLSLGHPTSNSDVIDNIPDYSTRWYAEILKAEKARFTREKVRLKEEARQQEKLKEVTTKAASKLHTLMLEEAQEYNLLLQSAKDRRSTIAANAFRQSLNSLQDEEISARQIAETTQRDLLESQHEAQRKTLLSQQDARAAKIQSLLNTEQNARAKIVQTMQTVLNSCASKHKANVRNQQQEEQQLERDQRRQEQEDQKRKRDERQKQQQEQQDRKAQQQARKEEQQQKQQMHEALQKKQQKAKNEKKGGKKKPPQMSREAENNLLNGLANAEVEASPESASPQQAREDWELFKVLLMQKELPEFPEELPKTLPKPLQEQSPEELREPILLTLMRKHPNFASKSTIVPNTQLKTAPKTTPLQPREAKQIKKKVKEHQHPITLELQTTKDEETDNNPTTVLQWIAFRHSPALLGETIGILRENKKLEHEINYPSQPASGDPTQPTFIALAYAAIDQCPEKAAILLNAGSEPGITSITAAFMNNSPEALSLILEKRAQNKAPEATLSDKTKLLKLDAEAGVNIAFLKIAVRHQKGQDEKLLPTLLEHIKATTSAEMYNSILYTLFSDTNIIDTMSHDQFEQILTLYDNSTEDNTHLSIRLVPRTLMRIANKKAKQGVHDAEGDAILESFFKRYPSALNTAVVIVQADGSEDIRTPLDFAVEARADGATMEMLLGLGADPTQNTTKETPEETTEEIAEKLPPKNAIPNTLHRAAALMRADQLACMLKYNPEWIKVLGNRDKNLLHTVLHKRTLNEVTEKWEEDLVVATVKAILDQSGVEDIINAQSECGDVPLHIAAEAGHVQPTKLLLKQEANPALINRENNTPLKVARKEIKTWKDKEDNLSEALKKAMKNDLVLKNSAKLTKAQILSYTLIIRILVESKAERLQNLFDQQDRGEAHPFRDKNAVIVASLRIFGFPEDEAKSAAQSVAEGKSFEAAMIAVIPELAPGK